MTNILSKKLAEANFSLAQMIVIDVIVDIALKNKSDLLKTLKMLPGDSFIKTFEELMEKNG